MWLPGVRWSKKWDQLQIKNGETMIYKNVNWRLRILVLFSLFGVFASCTVKKETINPTAYVDPQIGSVHGRWFFYTPACLLSGMPKLAPHTNAYGTSAS